MKKRILHLQTGNGITGGISEYIKEITSLQNSNFTFFVNINKEQINDKIYELFPNLNIIKSNLETYNLLNISSKIYTLRKILKIYKIKLIHSHALRSGMICVILKLFFDVKFIHTNHGLRFQQKKSSLKKFIFLLLEFIVINLSEKYVCIKKVDYEFLKSISPFNFLIKDSLNTKKLKFIKTKIKLPLYCTYRKETPSNEIPTVIGIGSLLPVKRVDLFINALSILKKKKVKFKSIWIGDGYLKGKLQEQINKKDIPLKLLGHLPKDIVLKKLSQSSLYLLTSEYEISPLALKEALWAGLPILSSSFTGIEEIINDQNNFKLFSNNIGPVLLAELIKKILEDKVLQFNMSKKSSQNFWENLFNDGTFNKYYFDIYKDIK